MTENAERLTHYYSKHLAFLLHNGSYKVKEHFPESFAATYFCNKYQKVELNGFPGKHSRGTFFFCGSCVKVSHVHSLALWVLSLGQWQKQCSSSNHHLVG